MNYLWQDKKKTQPVKQSDMKRTRRDRGELEDIVFKLFEKQPNWTLKQLVQETDQPAVCLLAVWLCLAKCYTQISQLCSNFCDLELVRFMNSSNLYINAFALG